MSSVSLEASYTAPSEIYAQSAHLLRPNQPTNISSARSPYEQFINNAFETNLCVQRSLLKAQSQMLRASELLADPDIRTETQLMAEDGFRIATSPTILWGVGLERSDHAPNVMLLPGLGTGDSYFYGLLDSVSRFMGAQPHLAGISENKGWKEDIDKPEKAIMKIADETSDGVILVGHSLGGIVAKAIALRDEQKYQSGEIKHRNVKGIILLASPADNDFAVTSNLVADIASQNLKDDPQSDLGEEIISCMGKPLSHEVPITAIYSRTDPIIKDNSGAAIISSHAKNLVLERASHFLLPYRPEVVKMISQEIKIMGN